MGTFHHCGVTSPGSSGVAKMCRASSVEQRPCSRCSTRACSLTPWDRQLPVCPVLPMPSSGHLEALGGTSPAASGAYMELRAAGDRGRPTSAGGRASLPRGLQAGGSGTPALGVSGRLHLVGWLPGATNPGQRQCPHSGAEPSRSRRPHLLTPAAASSDGDHEPPHLAGHRLLHCPSSCSGPEDLKPFGKECDDRRDKNIIFAACSL